MRDVRLVHAPGLKFDYSDTNYSVLGMIVQSVTGESYEFFIQEHVFEPLDMSGSFTSQDEVVRAGMATGYRYWFGYPKAAAAMPFVPMGGTGRVSDLKRTRLVALSGRASERGLVRRNECHIGGRHA